MFFNHHTPNMHQNNYGGFDGDFFASQELCLNCLNIDFASVFGLAKDVDWAIPAITVQYVAENEGSCRFCSLLHRAARQFTHPHRVIPHRNGTPLEFHFERDFREPVLERDGRFLPGGAAVRVKLRPPPSPIDTSVATDFMLCPMRMGIVDDLQETSRFVLDDRIDLGLCRMWLQNCLEQHPGMCNTAHQSSNLPVGFRVIDVINDCIICPPRDCRYICLSYVWGQVNTLSLQTGNLYLLETPGSLTKHKSTLAKTIKDSIEVTKALGERYLWVDCLCIIQDSPSKDVQIEAMDQIYGSAHLTLVAADGADANAGLHGIHSGSRQFSQIFEEIWADLTLVVSLPPPPDISLSPWATRGWTCQEQMLSRRLLLFTEGQAVWQCPSTCLCEDTAGSSKSISISRLPQVLSSVETLDQSRTQKLPPWDCSPQPLRRPRIFSQYATVIYDYSKRHLTFDEDILRAFEGFGSIIQREAHSTSIAGLPAAYLDQALLWMPAVQQQRRTGSKTEFPSWSWAGWKGQARYTVDAAEQKDDIEPIVPVIKWYVKDLNKAAFPVNQTGIGTDEACFGISRSSNTYCWVPIFELLSGRQGFAPNITGLESHSSTLLQFWTSCAFFDISLRDSPTILDQYEASRHRPLKVHLQISSSHAGGRGQLAGYAVLNGDELPASLERNRHEFIVISEAQVAGFNPINWTCQYSENCMMYMSC
ncbi:heterokaryon incompatibility protein-domain-containing protein [Xylariales sp. PMI_506]|nr:heterokaryon incompatibility protein-domain-containing protein [Xylariales sp. PMI_506]